MKILSVQSSVAYGHVGNSAATFPLQRLGHEVWPVVTVHFSNHTGYGAWRGPLLAPSDVADVIAGIGEREVTGPDGKPVSVLATADAVLSGYQGAEDVGAVILDAVARVKELNPAAVYCCDPVMGDVGRGMFVRPGIPEYMRDHVVPHADILTPNHFELDFLTDRTTRTEAEVLDAVDAVRDRGPRDVLVTSVITDETPAGTLEVLAVSDDGAWAVRTPSSPSPPTAAAT
ncbi:pyridoxal kinase [Nocardioides zeae]